MLKHSPEEASLIDQIEKFFENLSLESKIELRERPSYRFWEKHLILSGRRENNICNEEILPSPSEIKFISMRLIGCPIEGVDEKKAIISLKILLLIQFRALERSMVHWVWVRPSESYGRSFPIAGQIVGDAVLKRC